MPFFTHLFLFFSFICILFTSASLLMMLPAAIHRSCRLRPHEPRLWNASPLSILAVTLFMDMGFCFYARLHSQLKPPMNSQQLVQPATEIKYTIWSLQITNRVGFALNVSFLDQQFSPLSHLFFTFLASSSWFCLPTKWLQAKLAAWLNRCDFKAEFTQIHLEKLCFNHFQLVGATTRLELGPKQEVAAARL